MEPWAKKQVPDDGSTMKDESDAMPAVESGAGSGVESDAESNVRSDADSNALKVSEQRFNDIAEVASDWFWETDAQLRFTYMSERVFEATGVKPEFHYGKTRRELAAPDVNAPRWERHFQDMEARKPFKNFAFRRPGPDGRQQWIRTSGRPYYHADGWFGGYRGAGSNITEEVEAREAARRSEDRFRSVAESSFDRIWETDEQHRFCYISDPTNDAFNLPIDRLIGKTRWAAAGANIETDENWRRHVDDLNAHKPFRDFRFDRLDDDGEVRNVSVNGAPFYDEHGDFWGYRGSAADITARVSANRRAKTANDRLAAAIENLSEIFVLWDAQDRLVICNEKFRELNREVLETTKPGTPFEDHIRATLKMGLVPDAIDREAAYFEERLHNHKNPGSPVELERQDGKWLLVSEQKTAEGGVVTVSVDITERKEIERLKSEFVSTISHELRTPLTSIKGSLGLILAGALGDVSEKALNMVNVAHRNSDRLIGLVNDILDMEKLESGGMNFNFQTLDLSQLVRDAVENNMGFAEEHNVEFVLDTLEDGVVLRGDFDRLTQVVVNFLSNAAKFSPDGGVVQISMTRRDGVATVSVIDCGPGVPEGFRNRIFERFSQADGSDSRPKGGTGLGLNISKAIVEKHGGSIGFKNLAAGGASFYFSLLASDFSAK
ncbi:MAG: PAS domain S-box-containing protein [Alphaproteobacteria bacterium]|jgi:PAS domain S-box-containing protein